jgi:transposase
MQEARRAWRIVAPGADLFLDGHGWRKQLARADQATPAVRRGPKVNPATAQKRRDEQLNREIARLTRQLARANAIIDVQKKLCTLLGLPTAEEQELKD